LYPAGNGPARSLLALLWCSLSPLFCERAWQCLSLGLFAGQFSLSLSLFSPLFLWLSQSLGRYLTLVPWLPSGRCGQVCPKQCSQCLPVQPSFAGSLQRWELACNLWVLINYLFIFPPGYVVLWDCKIPHRPAGESVSWCLETSLKTPFLGRISGSTSFVSLFIFCPTSFQRQWAAFLGAWCPLPVFRSCSVEFAVFKCSVDEFVGEKVVSPSYSSSILGLPPAHCLLIGFSPLLTSLILFILDLSWLHLMLFTITLKYSPSSFSLSM